MKSQVCRSRIGLVGCGPLTTLASTIRLDAVAAELRTYEAPIGEEEALLSRLRQDELHAVVVDRVCADRYRRELGIPVVPLQWSLESLTACVRQAYSLSPKVAVLARSGAEGEDPFGLVRAMPALTGGYHAWERPTEIPDLLQRVKMQGAEVVVAGRRASLLAEREGLKAVCSFGTDLTGGLLGEALLRAVAEGTATAIRRLGPGFGAALTGPMARVALAKGDTLVCVGPRGEILWSSKHPEHLLPGSSPRPGDPRAGPPGRPPLPGHPEHISDLLTALCPFEDEAIEAGQQVEMLAAPVDLQTPGSYLLVIRIKGGPPAGGTVVLPVRTGRRLLLIKTASISYCVVESGLVYVHTDSGRYWTPLTLGALERQLDPRCFLRLDKHLLLNLTRLIELVPIDRHRTRLVLDAPSNPQLAIGPRAIKRLRAHLAF